MGVRLVLKLFIKLSTSTASNLHFNTAKLLISNTNFALKVVEIIIKATSNPSTSLGTFNLVMSTRTIYFILYEM